MRRKRLELGRPHESRRSTQRPWLIYSKTRKSIVVLDEQLFRVLFQHLGDRHGDVVGMLFFLLRRSIFTPELPAVDNIADCYSDCH